MKHNLAMDPYSGAERKSKILVVDDLADIRLVLDDLLSRYYEVYCVSDGQQALEFFHSGHHVDLILLDVVMPGVDGFEVCRLIKGQLQTQDIPVIFLSDLTDGADESKGFAIGGADFIHKPICDQTVLARVNTHLRLSQAMHTLAERADNLEQLVVERTRKITEQSEQLLQQKQHLIAAQDATITAFCTLAEVRDDETGNHINRTQRYVKALAEQLSSQPKYRDQLDGENIDLLFKSAPLHDIGKVAIPDSILLKPGKLTEEEWCIMQRHCEYGHNAIQQAGKYFGDISDTFLRFASEIALSHHEHWDGQGYPNGLCEEQIPLSARLMAVADVYDALITKRVYKPAFPHAKAMDIIIESSGSHFDPSIVEALLKIEDKFLYIAKKFNDHPRNTKIDIK